ncbi:molybdenum cofactor biosynthesis protein MoaE [Jeotgalibacillus malaysiensis]|uniref:Molybdopterin synthase catalytic subunit n=1 Tax=Jeotgalibacillus malaysiensis TaxID=1508404 RepID=A0A0B5APH2_9BACL|nr:molybdenum cofactor biosynthesis protein MoaE [Jeotgalibacillus malaysiensis]AJD89989.1 molybdenum cofactor biosynthesis protein MoaE [Jeotgalibacillus malaysiensis]
MFEVTSEPLSIEAISQKVVRPEAGAVVTFTGTVREFTKGKRTLYLTYEAYASMAEKQLKKIGDEIASRWPDAVTAISHRTGKLGISDIAVVIAVSTPHRKDAYEANEYAIERIKQIVPIWKKEKWEDGEEWIGDQLETNAGVPEKEEMK